MSGSEQWGRRGRLRTRIAVLGGPALVLLGLATFPVVRTASAQSGPGASSAGVPQVTTQLSSRRVEVGQDLVVQVTLMSSEGDSPTAPQLEVRGDAEVNGPSVRTELRMFSDGRSFTRQRGLTATWSVAPRKVGKLVVGPGSFQLGGKTVKGERVEVEVLPAGSTPPSPRQRRSPFPSPFGADPFEFFRGGPGWADEPFDDSSLVPSVPDELKMDRAPSPIAFLRQEATPLRVVVGEQVTLRLYVYGGRGPFAAGFAAQPTTADFLSFPTDQDDIVPNRVPIGDQVFLAAKLREVALIPLHAGQLTIGGAKVTLSGRGYPAAGPQGSFLVEGKPVTITVAEPPLAGRPPGYTLGDVGRFTLSATVEPRSIEQGGMVSVTARLEGTGNVPSRITPPEQNGVEWLEPNVRGEVGPRGTAIGGERVFRWTVHVTKAGTIDLGELSLPFFDPEKDRYEIARAALGQLIVQPGAARPTDKPGQTADAPSAASAGPLPPIPARHTLGAVGAAPVSLTDSSAYWWSLALVPLSVPTFAALVRAVRAVIERVRKRELGGTARVRSLLSRARRAASEDRAAAALDYERALYEAIETGLGIKARGVLRGELARQLERAGVHAARSEETTRAIADLETLRFTGEGDLGKLGETIERLALDFVARHGSRPRSERGEAA